MAEWTPACVEARLHEAVDVMQRLPEVRVQGYYSLWPCTRCHPDCPTRSSIGRLTD
jgi:hypothetical protein